MEIDASFRRWYIFLKMVHLFNFFCWKQGILLKKWHFFLFRISSRSFWHQRIYDTTLGSRDISPCDSFCDGRAGAGGVGIGYSRSWMEIVHNSQQLINRVAVHILKGGVTPSPHHTAKNCKKLPVQNFELGWHPTPPTVKNYGFAMIKYGFAVKYLSIFPLFVVVAHFKFFGQNSQSMKLSTVIMSYHIKFIHPAQPQKLVLGPICQGGDRKIKRRDWQRSCTGQLPVRSERSRSEIKMWSKPTGDEINWPKCRSNLDPSFIERYQITFVLLSIVSFLVLLFHRALELFYFSKHFTRKSSVAALAWSVYGPLIGKLWSCCFYSYAMFAILYEIKMKLISKVIMQNKTA